MIRDLSDFGPPKSSKINNFRSPSGPTNNSRLTPNSLFCDRIREKHSTVKAFPHLSIISQAAAGYRRIVDAQTVTAVVTVARVSADVVRLIVDE